MKKVKSIREVDKEYLDQNFYKKPKQIHLEAKKIILKNLSNKVNGQLKLVDFGSADGQLLYQLDNQNKHNIKLEGVEPIKKLAQKAKQNIKGANFKVGSVLDKNLYKKSSIDIAVSTGVLSIFKDHKKFIGNMLHWVRPNGIILIQSIFNNDDYDVSIDYKKSTQDSFNKFNSKTGWNIFCKKTISSYLINKKVKKFKFIDFNLKVNVKYNKNKPYKA
ncbi:class I SAM-dependent methyltransferase, partial [Candidatus Pelagibacter sp.]|nr:class I SAM-dependent methyltransferase [Candidatus Pelagibacter sp.]